MKNILKRIAAIFLSILVVLSSFSLPTLTTVIADEDPTEVVTEYAEDQTVPETSIAEEIPTEPVYEDTQESFDAPTQEFHEDITEVQTETVPEETAETEEETVKDDAPELNKETLPFYGAAGGVEVRVIADPETFPVGTTMTVVWVSPVEIYNIVDAAVSGEVTAIRAVDIKFYAPDGAPVQPKRPVHMTMQTPGSNVNAEKAIVHIGANKQADTIENVTFSGDNAILSALSFSIYAEVETMDATDTADEPASGEEPVRGDGEEVQTWTVSFDPNTDEDGELSPIVIEVNDGEAIGEQLPVVPQVPGYQTKWVISGTETEVTAETVVTQDLNAEVAQDEIQYTVTFVQENGDEETRTTSIAQGFAVNDLPEVTPKTNSVGKWVYEGTTNEFTVGTVIANDLTVEAYYEQNIFTVEFLVDGAHYEQMTTSTGTTIVLPSDPVKPGATFLGWFTEPGGQGTQYTASSTVDQDLTLHAFFENQVRVSFVVLDDQGQIIDEKSQYFVDLTVGDTITTLPDDPFVAGKIFDHWEHETTHEPVSVGTVVTDSFNAVAVFRTIDTYELTVYYYYLDDNQQQVEIQTQVFDLVEDDLPYTVTAPGYTVATEVSGNPVYYPSNPTITVNKADFQLENGKYVYSVSDEFVAADANYKVGHYLKNLSGDGYTLIETENKVGVRNSIVTPEIKSYAYAEYEDRDTDVTITGNPNQELKVYYNRSDFTLSYNVGAGDYIPAVTKPYGTVVSLPNTATRAGYTFAGWYENADYSGNRVSGNYTINANTTLYAKWNPTQSDYKIVYMIENADDDGYSYLATVTKQAATGSSITMTAQTAGAAGTRPSELDTQNFTFKDSTTDTAKADGSTVITVRYDRNRYTINWNGDVYNTNGGRRARNQGSGSITAKYGANITQQWVATFNNSYPNYAWSPTTTNNDKIIGIDTMPGRGTGKWNFNNQNTAPVYAFDFSTTKTQYLTYWLENYESDQTVTRDGKTYGLYKYVVGRFNYLYDNSDFYEINGYNKDGYTAYYEDLLGRTHSYTLGSSTPLYDLYVYFFYAADTHPLTFYNYDGTLISTQDVKLNADISSYLVSNVPSAPMEGATWLGWYTDAGHENPYTYTGTPTMPAGLVLYGNFEFPTRTVTFDSQGGSPVDSQEDAYGFYAEMPNDPLKDNNTFLGWFTAPDETGSPYDWNRPVTEDITLYAHWSQDPISYTVHYYEQGTTTSVLPDKFVSDPKFTEGYEITETAPTVAGHVSDKASVTKNLSFNEEENEIIFYYSEIPNEITYTVNYVIQGTNIKVAESKTVTVPGTTTNALEMAVEVDNAYLASQTTDPDILRHHFRPVETSKELQLALDDNVITFEYVSFTTSKITVNYLDMDGNPIEPTDIEYVEKGDTFTLLNKAPDGYVYHHAYLDGTTTAPQPTYQINGTEGDMVINVYYQRKLIIIANNKSKIYDGTEIKSDFANSSDYTIRGLLRDDEVTSLEFEGAQTNAGSSATTPKNVVIAKGAHAIEHPEDYYSIIYVPGTLTVKPVSVYISVNADQYDSHSGGSGPNYYTGQQFNVGFTNPNKNHFNDPGVSGSSYINITSAQRDLFKAKYGDAIWNALYGTDGALISQKDAGNYTFSGEQQRALLANVSVDGQSMLADPNYSITMFARDSFLHIVPLPLTITTPSGEKNYDGTALTKSEGATLDHSYWTQNIGGTWTPAQTASPGEVTLGTGDTITFNVTGSQTEVGFSDNTYGIDWGETLSSNYDIHATLGILTVNGGELSITVKDKTVPYNGEAQQGYTFTGPITGTGETIETDEYIITGLATGQVLTISGYEPSNGTYVGTYENGSFANAVITIKNSDDADVTAYYTISTTAGDLIITEATNPVTKSHTAKTGEGVTDTYAEGETVTFTVSAQNIYNQPVTITLSEIEGVTLAQSEFTDVAAGATVTTTASYTIKAADMAAGSFTNTVTAAYTADGLNKTYTASDIVNTEEIEAFISVTKTAQPSSNVSAGDEVTYTITVTNTGNATVSGINLQDAMMKAADVPAAFDLAPGANKEISYTYTVTQDDVDTGSISNTVTASGKDPKNDDVTGTATATVTTEEADAELSVTKTANPNSGVAVGATVTYTVTVTNSGNVTVSDIVLTDTLVTLTDEQKNIGTLAPEGTKTITYTYTVTQADVDTGIINNSATAIGKDPKNADVTGNATATVTTEEADAELTVTKTAEPTEDVEVDDEITYTVVVANSGNVTVSGINLADAKMATADKPEAFTLAPEGTKTITYEYTVTQADVDAGTFTNTVTATGTDPKDETVTANDSATVTTVENEAELTVEKTASPTSGVEVGDTVTYTVVVTNSGNVTVSGIDLADAKMAAADKPEAFTLAPEGTKTITYEYTVTQADVDAGKIENMATATGKDPKGADVTASGDAEVTTVAADAELTVEKTASPTSGVKVGDKVTYTVVITNSGNVTVSGIAVTDTLVTLSEAAFDLAPAGTKTITYEYTVKQSDIDKGKIDNTATATGKDPKNEDVTASDDAEVTTVDAEAALTVEKTAQPTSGVKVGDTVTYTIEVTNSGNVTVSGIKLTDTLPGFVFNAGAVTEGIILAPGESASATGTYTVLQADVDTGKIDNTATATGKDPSGEDVTVSDDAEVITIAPQPGIDVTKTATLPAGKETVAVGDTVTYTIEVKNTGNVTLNATLQDPLGNLNIQIPALAPNAVETITYSYTVTQADVDHGSILNTAAAEGVAPNSQKVTDSASVTVNTDAANAELTVEKSASPASGVKVGDTVTYTVIVTNSGNVTVSDIVLSDLLVTLTDEQKNIGTLAPEGTKTITYTYTVTQADVDAGEIENTATAKGKDPKDAEVSASDTAEVTTITADPKITVEKSAELPDGKTVVEVGDTVTYKVKVTNTGNVTVNEIALTDTLVTLSEAAFSLAPGANKEITYTYTVTQADVDEGKIDNTATATGKDPVGENVTASDDAEVATVTADAKLTVEKTANPNSGVAVSATVTYTVTVTNSGNVTVSDIVLADTLVTLTDEQKNIGTLAPEGTKTITYTYTVTQADVDAGSINNTVTATGKDPKNADVTGNATATVTTEEADAELTVTKTAEPASGVGAGDTVSYTVVVTNSGNVTISGITLADARMASADAPEAFTLTPGTNKEITYTYTVTQADVDAGSFTNTVTATGTDPKGETVTANDTATVTTVENEAELTVEKTASPTNGVEVGDTVTYTVVVTNSGNVTVSGIDLADAKMAAADKPEAFTLAPEGTKTITYTYTVTQADVDAGKIENTATATGKDPKGADVTASDDAEVTTVAADAELTVEKTASPTSGVKVGDKVTYTVVITNSGNVTVSGIAVNDTLVTLSEAAFDLAPAGTKTITYEYTVKQSDIDKGKIDNTATATGKDPKNEDVTASDDAEVTTVAADAKLTVSKSAAPASGVKVGDTVTYTVVVTNSGNVTVSGITLADAKMAAADTPEAFELAPAGTKTITYTYTVTQADVDAGKIDNTATATGKDPKNEDVTASDDAEVTTVTAAPQLTVEKGANPASGVVVGDTITYTVVVTNSGNVTISGIEIEDALMASADTPEAFELAPAGTKTITYTYTVTQADVDAGKIDNTATATGKDPKDADVSASDTAEVTTVTAAPQLTVEKSAAPASGVKVGDTVTYTVVVTNSGNVTVSGITLADAKMAAADAPEAFELAPAGTKTITYTYTVTQADVDTGKIDNTATAKGKDPKNTEVTASDDAEVTTVTAAPQLTVEKSANPASGVKVGDTVTYTVVVTNSGNVTVSGITLADEKMPNAPSAFDLAPGASSEEFAYNYTVTQADVDAGQIDNTATARGKDPKNQQVEATGTATVTTETATPELSVTKTSDKEGMKVSAGDTVTYTVVVTNSGNVTVKDIELSDTLVTFSEPAFDLAPAGSKTITYTYTVTQADVDAGQIDNTVTATGKDPKDADVTGTDSETVTAEDAAAHLTVTKTASKTTDAKAGDEITYTVTVTNDGNVTVKNIELSDTLVDLDKEAFDLAPGESKTDITYTYTVTQADVDVGQILNTVTASGKDPKSVDVSNTASATVTAEEADAKLNITKTASKTENAEVGDEITYTVKVENIGNVTVKDITLTDTLVTLTDAQKAVGTLAPNESQTITYTYTVTQADVDKGQIENTATATGKDPKNADVTDDASVTVTAVEAEAELTVTKSASKTSGAAVGDVISYTVKVKNTGNVTVKDITLTDTLVTLTDAQKAVGTLAPGAEKEITYTYTVTQADVDKGQIDNTATATGKDPKNADVTDDASVTVTAVEAEAELTVTKTASKTSDAAVGDVITYTVKVENTGNVTVKDITLTDTLVTLTGAQQEIGTLAPEGSKTITYTYTVTQADVDKGQIDNTATATGKDPKNTEVTASDDEEVTTEAADPELTVEKGASPESGVKVGDEVTYTVTVTNSGNVTVKNITLADDLVSLQGVSPFELAPNATKTITYTYTVKQADVDEGKIDNTVKAVGKDPQDNNVEDESSATVTTEAAAGALTVEKSADPAANVKVGDMVTYTVVVTNSGNVTISGIEIEDALMASADAPEAFELAPGESKDDITYTYTVTQADVDKGQIDNIATASGKDPKDADVTASDTAEVTTVTATPQLTVEKSANPASGVKVGDTVTYSVVVTNSGNVTISGIEIEDELMASADAPEAFDLAPGESKDDITYTYTVTQADVDAGQVDNTATATGKDPKNTEVTASDDATVTTEAAKPALTVIKTSDKEDVKVSAGDTVTYTVVVTNSGNVTVKDIELSDTLVTLSEPAFDLVPEGTKTIIYTYTVTQADVDKGQIVNTVTATGKDPKDADVTGTDSETVTAEDAAAHLTVTKTASKTTDVKAGDDITYTVTVTNDGNVTVKNIELSDTLVDLDEEAFDLAPGESKTDITYTYTVTQADVDEGQILNTVTASGKDPKSVDVSNTASATVTAEEADAKLNITKTASKTENAEVGDVITYTVKVENTGNVTVKDITLTDTLVNLTDDQKAVGTLAPNESQTITYTYTVTQADVDNGQIDNTATATGKDPKNADVTDDASVTVTAVEAEAELTVTKSASKTNDAAVGDEITYTVKVVNSGNVTVKDITLTDTLVTLTDDQKAVGTLAPEDSKTITYTYTVTQEDVDEGKIDNTATATGKDPKNADVTDDASVTVTAVEAEAELTVTKSASKTSDAAVGDVITYTVKVENTGNVTVKDITLTDTLVNLTDAQKAVGTLAPGAEKEITYTYTVTQADVDKGQIENTATATGKDPKNADVTDDASVTVTAVEAEAELTVTKSASKTSDAAVGDVITYTVKVENTGNVTVKDITLTDTLVTLTGAQQEIGTLAPEGSKTITYTYTVTQADVDKGQIENTATATGKDPKDEEVSDEADVTVTTVTPVPELSVTKTADQTSAVALNDTVTYTVVVTNTGNVTVSSIALSDTLVDLNETPFDLAPQAAKTITYTYVVKQSDVDAGQIDNTVTATGKDPKEAEVSDEAEATVQTVDADAQLSVTKTADKTTDAKVGDTITYTVKVKNSGNVTVSDIELTDTLVSLSSDLKVIGTLLPGAEKEISYPYEVTQADVDAGQIINTATAKGKDPKADDVEKSATATVTAEDADAQLSVSKTADKTENVKVGDTVTYTVVVTNSGNVTIKGITISDTLVALAGEDAAAFDLAPDESKTITYDYTVTQADVDKGKIDNTATAKGKDPKETEVSGSDNAVVTTVTADPGLTVEKSANKSVDVCAGDTVTYTVNVMNSGNVTIKGITISDTLVALTGEDAAAFDLAPGESKTITYDYTVTQADVDNGKINNKATASGKDPSDNEVKDSDEVEIAAVEADPVLAVVKAADKYDNVNVGDTVTYIVGVSNEGNVTIKDITISDTLVTLTGEDAAAFDLAPDGYKSISYTYTVTQADVDKGKIDNTATVSGKDPSNNEVQDSDKVEVMTADAAPSISVTKESDQTGKVSVGDKITYTVEVKNTGNVTLYSIELEDTLVTLSETAFTLAPSGTKTISYEYTVTQADVDNGKIDNTVTVTGNSPKGVEVSDTDSITVEAEDADAKLSVTKTAEPDEDAEAGDTVTYTVVIKNNGNVTVSSIVLEDSLVTLSGGDASITSLAPGEQKEITYTYTVTQADVDKGEIKNTLTAKGKDPQGNDVEKSGSVIVETVPAEPSLNVTKEASKTSGAKVGDTITYTVTVENDGNVSMTGISLQDTLVSLSETPFDLAPAGKKVVTYTYIVTQADVDNGKIDNKVTAAGKDPNNTEVTKDAEVTVTAVPAEAELKVTKTASKTSGAVVEDTITYTVKVENSGNVTVKGITLNDTLVPLNEAAFDLAPGADKELTYTYTVTQDDVDAGQFENTVTATGSDPKEAEVSGTDKVTVNTLQNGHLTVTKVITGTAAESGYALGDTINYKVTVTNDGNLTIADITVTDELTADEWTIESMAPGAVKEFTTSHTVTEEDILNGKVVNEATATGTSPDPDHPDVPVTPGSVEAPVEKAEPALIVTKTADKSSYAYKDGISYTIVVKNNGNLQINDITVTDALTGSVTPDAAFSLNPGESKTLTASYTVSAADAKAGTLTNVAIAAGTASNNKAVTASGDVTVDTTQVPISITAVDAVKTYDGEALKDANIIPVTELLSGDTIQSVKVEGSQTDVGNSPNVPKDAVIVDADGVDVTDGYSITYVPGKLTVNAANIEDIERFTVVEPEDTVYNGQEQEQPLSISDAITGKELVEGKDYTITYSEDVTNVGAVTVTVEGIGNYTGTRIATYQITPKPVTVTANDITKNDGETDPELTVTIEGLVDGESEDLITYEISREDGEKPGSYLITVTGEEEQGNYIVTFVDGEFTIYATITYILTGGNIDGDEGPIVFTGIKIGTTIEILKAPVREGYEFEYWEGSEYYPGDSYLVNDSHTFTAVWKEIKKEDVKPKGGNSIKTGDTNNIVPLVILMTVAGLTIIVLLIVFIRRRKQDDEA